MNITGLLLVFPTGFIMGVVGGYARLPKWMIAALGVVMASAVFRLCILLDLP